MNLCTCIKTLSATKQLIIGYMLIQQFLLKLTHKITSWGPAHLVRNTLNEYGDSIFASCFLWTCETWFLTLREEFKLQMSGNEVFIGN